MPVSRGRKPKQKNNNRLNRKTAAQSRQRIQKALWERVRDHPVFWSLGLLAALIAVGTSARDAFREPEIHAHAGAVLSPFELHFSLHNPSWILWMKEMDIHCSDKNIIFSNGTRLANNIVSQNLSINLPPGKTVEYTCPISRAIVVSGAQIVVAQVAISADFKTPAFARKHESDLFTWTAQSKQWVEGDIIN